MHAQPLPVKLSGVHPYVHMLESSGALLLAIQALHSCTAAKHQSMNASLRSFRSHTCWIPTMKFALLYSIWDHGIRRFDLSSTFSLCPHSNSHPTFQNSLFKVAGRPTGLEPAVRQSHRGPQPGEKR